VEGAGPVPGPPLSGRDLRRARHGRSDRPVTPEAHTEQVCVADLEAVLAATEAPFALSKEEVEEICRRVRAPLTIRSGSTC
jgi:hypothetical protein